MNCRAEVQKNYDTPTIAGAFQVLLGLTMLIAGLYISTLTNFQGHGFGLILILGSPFVILKDSE